MRRPALWLPALVLLAPTPLVHASEDPPVLLSEIVSDPQTDWTGDGRVTASDEYVELHNAGATDVDLTGWTLRLADTTPADTALQGVLVAGGRHVVQNPTGDTNNDGHALLLDAHGRVRDEIRYGAWPNATAPTANANGPLDESLRRLDAWTRGPATPHRPNDALGWRTSSTLTPVEGWVGPNTTATFTVTVLADASNPVRRLQLHVDGNTVATVEHPGAQTLSANHTHTFRQGNGTLTWHATRVDGDESHAFTVRVDAQPPSLVYDQTTHWHNGTSFALDNVRATDAGVGHVEYQWRWDDNLSAWSADPGIEARDDELVAQVRARDGFNNTSSWSSPFEFRRDDLPPSLHGFTATSQGELSWDASDTPSGLHHFELTRTADDHRQTLTLAPNQRVHSDTTSAAARVSYTLVAVDHAGNRSPSALANITTDAAKPAVKAIRASKALWSSGSLEVRIDFDRPMDTATAPSWETPPIQVKEARFLANRSTYYILASLSDATPEGSFTIRVLDATANDGTRLRAAAEAHLLVDLTPPTLRASLPSGTTRASTIELTAQDASPVRVTWTLFRPGNATSTAEGESDDAATIRFAQDGPWRVRAVATDASGKRSPELNLAYTVDREPPSLTANGHTVDGRFLLHVHDDTSGVDWQSLALSSPTWPASIDEKRQRITVQAAEEQNATLTIADHAGNHAQLVLTPSRVPEPVAETTAQAPSIAPPPAQPTKTASMVWPSALAFVGGIAAAIPLRRGRALRRKRQRSFGRRLRAILADTAPNDAVKDGPPG